MKIFRIEKSVEELLSNFQAARFLLEKLIKLSSGINCVIGEKTLLGKFDLNKKFTQ
jgi:hypothetical protein